MWRERFCFWYHFDWTCCTSRYACCDGQPIFDVSEVTVSICQREYSRGNFHCPSLVETFPQDPEIGEHILYVYLPPSPCKTTVLTLLELIRTHNLWGSVARRACRNGAGLAGPESEPWKADSEYERLTLSLRQWSQALPKRHTWSVRNLRGYKAECLDLA